MDGCPDQESIRRWAQQSCSDDERRSMEAHLASCADCRRRAEIEGPQQETQTTVDQGALPTRSMPAPSCSGSDESAIEIPPHVFEGYQILEELPQGGQAVVYKAIHKPTRAKVALKVLLPALTASAKARQYFKQEVELAASLNHPNIVAIRDSGIARGQYYFTMNYIHGQPLDRYVQAKTFSLREKLILFSKICDAMKHAHQRGVIHRDLKPSNILVDERDEPHILDFGLAKTAAGLSTAAETTVMPTMTGQIKGTVAYMSPEQAAGRSDLVDVRTDVYSLGVILYQMCTGRLPYDVMGTILEALKNIQHTEPARPRQTISRFNSDAEAIILKCLAKDPDQRYQSAAELKQEVQRWLDGLPIVAKSVSSIYLLRKIVARHRYTATVLTSLLVMLCSFAYISFYLYRDASGARRRAEAIARQWSDASGRQLVMSRQLAFRRFLEAWHSKDPSHARQAGWIASFLATDSLERKGADFLLDPNRLEDKADALRAELPRHSQWFADLVIGEEYLRRQDQARALDAYQRGRAELPPENQPFSADEMLREHMEAKLYQLTGTATRGNTHAQPPETGGQK